MFRTYIVFSLLTKCLCGRLKCICGQDGMASRAGFGPRAVVWRPLRYTKVAAWLLAHASGDGPRRVQTTRDIPERKPKAGITKLN